MKKTIQTLIALGIAAIATSCCGTDSAPQTQYQAPSQVIVTK